MPLLMHWVVRELLVCIPCIGSPHLPTKSMGFYHAATEVWYDEASTSYKVCSGGEDPSCSDRSSLCMSLMPLSLSCVLMLSLLS